MMATERGIIKNGERKSSFSSRMNSDEVGDNFNDTGSRKTSARWKLQHKRQSLNQKIHKQTKLRDGAENLTKALRISNDRKIKQAAKTELSFANSQLDLLKEELEGINSMLDVYQFDRGVEHQIPLIAVGFRETKELDFRAAFKDFILEHYSEDAEKYEKQLELFENLRKSAVCKVSRDESGIQALFTYFNQLYFIEKKFFPKGKPFTMPVYFHWYDTMTGLPKIQSSIAFEKASILFNIGSLWSQIGVKQDRRSKSGLDAAIDAFQKAAGVFKFIKENFINSPSADLTSEMMNLLMALMLVQAQFCMKEKQCLDGIGSKLTDAIEMAQECAEVGGNYLKAQMMTNVGICLSCVPSSWRNMLSIMCFHHRALSHYYIADGLLQNLDNPGDVQDKETISLLCNSQSDSSITRKKHAKAHLHSALKSHEEAMKARQICRHCRKMAGLQKALQEMRERTTNRLVAMEEEDDFDDPITPAPVKAFTRLKVELTPPNFAQASVEDLFHRLGPVHVFNANSDWSVPRSVHLQRENGEFGFSVIGSAPVIVQSVEDQGPAKDAGIQVGDIIIGVNGADCKWGDHSSVVSLVRNSKTEVTVDVVTPSLLTDIATLYNVKLCREDNQVTSDYSTSSSLRSQSSCSSRNSSLNGAFSNSSSSNSSVSLPATHARHSAVLGSGSESFLW